MDKSTSLRLTRAKVGPDYSQKPGTQLGLLMQLAGTHLLELSPLPPEWRVELGLKTRH